MENIDTQVQIKKPLQIIEIVQVLCLAGVFLNFGIGLTMPFIFANFANQFAKYIYRIGNDAYIKWVDITAWANIITCVIPILGFFTGSFTLTYGACAMEKDSKTNKYIFLGSLAILPYLIFFVVTTVLFVASKLR